MSYFIFFFVIHAVHGKFCDKLKPPLFGEVKCPRVQNLAAQFPPGSECYIKCYKGYKFDGDTLRVCNADGQWTGRSGECIRKFNF